MAVIFSLETDGSISGDHRSLSAMAEWIESEESLDALIADGYRIVRYACDPRDESERRNTGYIGLHTLREEVRKHARDR